MVLFTDSESVRGSFLKTWSAKANSDDMISVIFELEEGFHIPLWIERVPSQSNPSDVLSREAVSVFEVMAVFKDCQSSAEVMAVFKDCHPKTV